jgi:hypothetical protein
MVRAPVFGSDGHEIGQVKEIRGDRFLVDVRMHPDYWLSMQSVASVRPQGVWLNVTKAHVGDVKTGEPDYNMTAAHDAAVESFGPWSHTRQCMRGE